MKNKINYQLYLVTDQDLMSSTTLEEAVELAVEGGCTVVQLREKNNNTKAFYQTATNIKRITNKWEVPLIINDRVDIALAVDADGVHVGQGDLPVEIVRKIIGNNKILGVSVSNVLEALKAEQEGADYLGVGAMYATNTKNDAVLVSIDELQQIKARTSIPIVAIGGINEKTVWDLSSSAIDGIAVVSAILAKPNIKLAAQELRKTLAMLKIKG